MDLRELARALREGAYGAGETINTLGTGMLAEVPAGLAGLTELARTRDPAKAAARVQALRERYTYQPQSSVGQRGVENIGKAIEGAKDVALRAPGAKRAVGEWSDFSAQNPMLAAGLVAAANVVGPGGKTKSAERSAATSAERAAALRSRPLPSGQMELAGLETTPAQRLEQAQRNLEALETVADAPMRTDAPLQTTGRVGVLTQSRDIPYLPPEGEVRFRPPAPEEGPKVVLPDRGGVASLNQPSGVGREHYVVHRGTFDPEALGGDPETAARIRRIGLMPEANRAIDLIEALRGKHEAVDVARAEEARSRIRGLAEQSEALGPAPTEPLEYTDWATQRARIAREKPIVTESGRVFESDPESPNNYIERGYRRTPHDIEALDPSAYAQLMRARALREEALGAHRTSRDIREFIESDPRRSFEAEYEAPSWAQQLTGPRMRGETPAGADWWRQKLGVADYEAEPNLMNREAVAAFLEEAQTNPALFTYGLAPPENVRSLEQMARHFGNVAGERIRIDYTEGESDEPYKIKVPKEHAPGEVMRDRYGDYKMETYEPGAKMYEPDTGELKTKTKEVELVGPPEEQVVEMYRIHRPGEAPALYGEKEIPRRAEGGEVKVDESGEYVYQKSRGGEPVRDERGRQKYTEEENPDYSEGEEQIEVSMPGGAAMQINPSGSEHAWTATGVGKGKGGDLLYQTLLANAVREGIEVGSFGLTSDNQLRLLSNTLSNYARMGENPRSVTGTLAGRAERARGRAEGPEIWRAEAEEAKERLRAASVKPERVHFDGDKFTVDGKEVKPDKLLDAIGWKGGQKNIGQKTVMRMAFFDWLRGTDPAEAAKAAKKWKDLGPLFATVAGAAVGVGALSEEKENAD